MNTPPLTHWNEAFSQTRDGGFSLSGDRALNSISTLEHLKERLDLLHAKTCLIRPFFEEKGYPLVDARELLPSFESDLYEYTHLPGFSLVAFGRPLDYFREIFQFDILHCPDVPDSDSPQCLLEQPIHNTNLETCVSRLPRHLHAAFRQELEKTNIAALSSYPDLLPFILHMDRGHVLALNANGDFHVAGVYASFPSDLDAELKRYGLRIGKFKSGDNVRYERHRLFVYQFLMELYGFPIASERRTSAALFARRLFKMGEDFLVRVLGQSDRTVTSLYSHPKAKNWPFVEKLALVAVSPRQSKQLRRLDEQGYFLRANGQTAALVRVRYRQHKYNPYNIREDRAMSVMDQCLIHPLTAQKSPPVNVVKDTSLMTLKLNDIVRGEFMGRIKYKRHEIVENTETIEKRLKFLSAWLNKHQRRILGYSDEFYTNVVKVLDSFLLNPEYSDAFHEHKGLFQEVLGQYNYIRQARKIKELEDLADREYKGKRISYLQMLQAMTEIMNELKFDLVSYFDHLVEHALQTCNQVLGNRYLKRHYLEPPVDRLTDYGREVRKIYGHLVKVCDEVRAISRSRQEPARQTPHGTEDQGKLGNMTLRKAAEGGQGEESVKF